VLVSASLVRIACHSEPKRGYEAWGSAKLSSLQTQAPCQVDHAGGIEDFPDATVHVVGAELDLRDHKMAGSTANGIGRDNGIGISIGSATRPRESAGSAFLASASWSACRRKS
jgi:hypothetical protein